MRYLFLVLIAVGCAKSNMEAAKLSTASVDMLFKDWQNLYSGGPNWNLDLSAGNTISAFKVAWTEPYFSICQSDATISLTTPGDKSSGTLITSNTIAIFQDPNSAPCSRYNDTWSWTLINGVFEACGLVNGPCVNFY